MILWWDWKVLWQGRRLRRCKKHWTSLFEKSMMTSRLSSQRSRMNRLMWLFYKPKPVNRLFYKSKPVNWLLHSISSRSHPEIDFKHSLSVDLCQSMVSSLVDESTTLESWLLIFRDDETWSQRRLSNFKLWSSFNLPLMTSF